MGINATYNASIQSVQSDFVLLTDADVITEKDALKKAMAVMMNLDNVGGVTARMLQASEKSSLATYVEEGYRRLYDEMSICESAVGSTFPGYGAFILMRKSDFTLIEDHRGSSDGNISLGLIDHGKSYLYVPDIVFYERIAGSIMEQRRQKVRRASRLIQSLFLHKNLLFNRDREEFGTIIFPLRFIMIVISPLLFFIGSGALVSFLILSNQLLLAPTLFLMFMALCFGIRYKNVSKTLRSFLFHQFYLMLGLLMSYRKFVVWQQINR
jgi:biofilm PGA synthesis N-glycosyltransferase PgaC